MSNAKKAIKNGIYGMVGQTILYIVKFIDRRIFLRFLSIELLGYNSLFSDIFNLLSVAELGISSVIVYNLYKAFATNNKGEINILMSIYKHVYRLVGCIVFILGLAISLFLHQIVRGNSLNWSYIYIIYFLILLNTVLGYFLSYKSTLYVVAQRDYVTVEINVLTNIVFSIIKLISLVLFKNYIIYLLLGIINSVTINLIIYIKSRHDFPNVFDNIEIKLDDIKKRKMLHDIKYLVIGRLNGSIFFSIDSILISRLFGVAQIALYSNYNMISSNAMSITIRKISHILTPSIGNSIHSGKDINNIFQLFKRVDLFYHLISLYFSIIFFCISQWFINFWIGDQYLLSNSFIIVFCTYLYIMNSLEGLCNFRAPYGEFEYDYIYSIYSSIANILFSVLLAKFFGFIGIMIGTIAGFFFIAYGRIKFVFDKVLFCAKVKYLYHHLVEFFEYCIGIFFSYILIKNLSYSFYTIFLRLFVAIFIPTILVLIRYFKDDEFWELIKYIKDNLLSYRKINFLYYKIKNIINK